MNEVSNFWNNASTPILAGMPKIISKVACRGVELPEPVKVRLRAGGIKRIHKNQEEVHIFASMPGDAIFDNTGEGKGSYFVEALVEILRNEKWRKESLYSMIIRMRKGITEAVCGKELVHFESTNTKKIFFDKKRERKQKDESKEEEDVEKKKTIVRERLVDVE